MAPRNTKTTLTPSKKKLDRTKLHKSAGKAIQRFANDSSRPSSGLPFSAGSAASTAPHNETGLPDHIKSGAEYHSGISLNDVRVHYNSPKPATMQAHAYTQGNQIHVAPGQERYLGHETWHAVQQKQSRVTPNRQLKGLNDCPLLEKEADVMGEKLGSFNPGRNQTTLRMPDRNIATSPTTQKKSLVKNYGQTFTYEAFLNNNIEAGEIDHMNTKDITVGKKMESWLDPNDPLTGTEAGANDIVGGQKEMMKSLKTDYNLGDNELIRGHLLNAKLGGLADNNNLYPISSEANKEHESAVERKVKTLAWDQDRKAENIGVHYEVNIIGNPMYDSGGCNISCSWEDWDITNNQLSNEKRYDVDSHFDKRITPSHADSATTGIAQTPAGGRTLLGYNPLPGVGEINTIRGQTLAGQDVYQVNAPEAINLGDQINKNVKYNLDESMKFLDKANTSINSAASIDMYFDVANTNAQRIIDIKNSAANIENIAIAINTHRQQLLMQELMQIMQN